MRWSYGELHCPINSDYRGPEMAPCMVDLIDGAVQTVAIYAPGGIPKNVWVSLDSRSIGTWKSVIKDLKIECDTGWSTPPFETSDFCWY